MSISQRILYRLWKMQGTSSELLLGFESRLQLLVRASLRPNTTTSLRQAPSTHSSIIRTNFDTSGLLPADPSVANTQFNLTHWTPFPVLQSPVTVRQFLCSTPKAQAHVACVAYLVGECRDTQRNKVHVGMWSSTTRFGHNGLPQATLFP